MKKITIFIVLMITSLGFSQQNFPFNFESPTVFNDFDLAVTSLVVNPSATGINTSATVAKIVRGAAGYSGTKITVAAPIDFTTNKVIKMKVWFPVAGQGMIMKFEKSTNDPAGNFERSVTNVPAMVWTEVSFDYQVGSNNTRDQLVFLFNPGVDGNGGVNSTYYFDDITFSPPTIVYDPIVLPLNFENTNQNFSSFGDFGGGVMTKVANPDPTGNSSATCLRMVKGPGGEVYGGSSFFMSSPIDLSKGKFFSMKVWAPNKPNAFVALKFEDGGYNVEVPSANLVPGWQTVTFDFSSLDVTKSLNKVVLFNELNAGVGDGAAYYYDDLVQSLTALSTAKFDKSTVKMYPNPVQNTLTIEANSEIQRVSVYNVLGQEVMSRSPKSNSTTLQTSELRKGVYMVQTEIDGKVSSSKIVKE